MVNCIYCGKENGRVDSEGVGIKCCKDLNDEELRDYSDCDFCGNEARNGSLREFNGEMGCPDCVGVCDGCGDYYYRDDGASCDFCDLQFCSECVDNCEICKSRVCSDCGIECSKCGNVICPDCSVKIKGKKVCEDCEEEMNEKQSTLKACA